MKNKFTVRSIKLKEYSANPKITLMQLKEAMIRYYYPNMEDITDDMTREFIITPIKNCYGHVGTTIFSVNGSPPKGECVLIHNTSSEEWNGTLIFIGNGKESKSIRMITIIKEDENGEQQRII
jgi:hypothetical protein